MARFCVSALLALGLAISGSGGTIAAQAPTYTPTLQAQNPRAAAPAELQSLIQSIDDGANKRDLPAVLERYSPEFQSTDGLTRPLVEQLLTKIWQSYPTLTYRTTLDRWQRTSTGWQVELTTTITGSGTFQDQPLQLQSTLKSQQQIVNGKIISQDILAESTQVTSGAAPPTVQFNLPANVKVGQDYNLDVVVQEPLGNSLLLGSAVVQPINAQTYLEPPSLKLELLPAGGLFKVGRAPNQAGSQWISIALIRDTGKILMTQRLRVGQP